MLDPVELAKGNHVDITKGELFQRLINTPNSSLKKAGLAERIYLETWSSAEDLKAKLIVSIADNYIAVAAVAHGNFLDQVWVGPNSTDLMDVDKFRNLMGTAKPLYPATFEACFDKTHDGVDAIRAVRNSIKTAYGIK